MDFGKNSSKSSNIKSNYYYENSKVADSSEFILSIENELIYLSMEKQIDSLILNFCFSAIDIFRKNQMNF
jgi:hypothetical protein